ncbi:ATP-dependent nuclease [Nitrosomonas oligotropha]|nr:AAA family ATPase [Nitrosomonas oligotropha]
MHLKIERLNNEGMAMRISKITIENFRSIKHAEIDVAEFNVFVGQNNHGKTNLFEAVEWFYTGKGDMREIKHNGCGNEDEFFVEIKFSDIQDGISRITNSENQTKLKNILGDATDMRVRRSSKSVKDRLLYHPSTNEWKKQPAGADSAFNNCIPRFEFVEATKSLKEVSQFKNTTPIGQMLSAVVEEVLEKDESYREFRSSFERLFQADDSGIRQTLNGLSEKVKLHLAQQFPDCIKVEFIVNEPQFEELLKNYQTKIDDGIQTTAEEKGDGMQRALMLAIIKTFADFRREDALGRAFIFFIDEAELHLHPAAQRQLKAALIELSQGADQVFVTTHSSVLIADEHSKQKIFKAQKVEKQTVVSHVIEDKHEVVYELLGGNPADLLFPANFMLVEGPSEKDFLNGIINRFYKNEPAIQVVAAEGDHDRLSSNMEALNLIFRPLDKSPIYGDRVIILCDAPHQDKVESFRVFKAQNSQLEIRNQLYVLPDAQIENYYPVPWKTADKIKPHQKRNLAKKVAREITQTDFENQMSIIFSVLKACWKNAHKIETV